MQKEENSGCIGQGVTKQLAAFSLETKSEDIPERVFHEACRLVLDGLGCALGACSISDSYITSQVFSQMGGRPEATAIGTGERLPIALTACINAKRGNLLDADDVFYNSGHQSPIALYPALAAAEYQKVSGSDFLAAFVIGYEIASRVVLGVGSIFDLVDGKAIPSDATGFGQAVFGGVAAIGRLFNFEQVKMENAFGIAGMQCPAPLSHKSITDASMTKYQLDWAAAAACFAACLAQGGQEGPRTILDDHIFAHALSRKKLNHDAMLEKLGQRWCIEETSIKPYPHCRHTHYAFDALRELVIKHDIKYEDIRAVIVNGFSSYGVHPWSVLEPKNIYEAQFSLPYGVAMILLKIQPGPAWFAKELLEDKRVKALAKLVRTETNPLINEMVAEKLPEPLSEIPTTVTVVTKENKFTHAVRFARGDNGGPTRLDDKDVLEKFKINAGAVLPEKQVDALADEIWELKKAKDLTKLISLLKI